MSVDLETLKNEGWLSPKEMSEKLSISERALRRYRQLGYFDKIPFGSGKVLYRQVKNLSEECDNQNDSEDAESEGVEVNTATDHEERVVTVEKTEKSNKSYWFDKSRDLYVFSLKSKSKPFPLHGDIVSAMLADYSSLAGRSATIEEMSRKHGLSRTTITEVLKALGKTHSSMPYSDETLMEEDEDVLVEDFLRIKEEQIIQKTEKAEWTSIKKDAQKWRAFQRNALDEIYEKIDEQSNKYSVPKINLHFTENKNRRFASVITPTDFHYGKYGWSDESGENYTREIAEKLLIKRTTEALELVLEFGVPEKFIVGAGSDWFHIDTWGGTTTNGTPQDTDGCFSQIFIEGCDLAVKYVDILRQVAPVEIVLMAGNHDRQNSLSVLNYLYAWYKNNPDVEVRRSPAPRQYIRYGNSLLGFTHGDKPALKYLPSLMSNEARKHWGECDYRMWFTGDKHHEMTLDLGGTQIYQMPCLSGEDRWHVQNGFTTSRKALSSYLIDVKNGMFASVYAQGGHKS